MIMHVASFVDVYVDDEHGHHLTVNSYVHPYANPYGYFGMRGSAYRLCE